MYTKVSGALYPEGTRALKHSKDFYESVRKRSGDCKVIQANLNKYCNLNVSVEVISMIKAYIFYAQHDLPDGFKRFAPSYEMAESWRRLSDKSTRGVLPHDLLLIQHELTEILLILQKGYDQEMAHICATQQYNYQRASDMYYKSLGLL